MQTLHLDDHLRTGIVLVDEQHAGLIALHNQIAEAAEGSPTTATILELLSSLYEQSRLHFETEERIMEQLDYPDLPAHAAEHETLIHELRRIVLDLRTDEDAVPQQMVRFLREWVVRHISEADIRLKHYIDEHPEVTDTF